MTAHQKRAIERLTALWALSESGLGGIMHAIKIPFTGLIVGGIAVIIVSLICVLSGCRWKVVGQSLLIVLAIKMAISPHASFTAYFAVSFQAVAAWIFYSLIQNKAIASFVTGIICMLESALQKLIVLTIFYGKTLWDAIDKLGETATRELGWFFHISSSQLLIYGYLLIYLLNGILIGKFLAGFFNKKLLDSNTSISLSLKSQPEITQTQGQKNTTWIQRLWRPGLFWILLFIVLILMFFGLKDPGSIWKYIIRVLLIFVFWFSILGPFVNILLKKFLEKRHSDILTGTENTFGYFPYLKQIIPIAWKESTGHIPGRIVLFLEKLLLYTLSFDIDEEKNHTP